jgi:hypothetical protein
MATCFGSGRSRSPDRRAACLVVSTMSIWHIAPKDQSNECDAYAPHGYFGIETQAVDRMPNSSEPTTVTLREYCGRGGPAPSAC